MADKRLPKDGEKASGLTMPGLINGLKISHIPYEPSKKLKNKEERTIRDLTTYDLVYLKGICEQKKGEPDVDSFYDFINCVLEDNNVGPLSKRQVRLMAFYKKNCPKIVKGALELSEHVSETESEIVYKNGKRIPKTDGKDRDSELVRMMDTYDEHADLEHQIEMDDYVARIQKEVNVLGTKLAIYRKAAKSLGLRLQKGKLVQLTEQNEKTCGNINNHDEFWKDVSQEDVSVYDIEQHRTEMYELTKEDLEEQANCAHETEELKLAYIEILQKKLSDYIMPETGEPRSIQAAEKLVDIITFLDTPKDIEHNYMLGQNYILEATLLEKAKGYINKNKKPQD